MRCGFGSNIELFSYQSPDQQVVQPKNSDVGGYHIAFYVDDIKAGGRLSAREKGWTHFGPVPIKEGPGGGADDPLFQAPWGLQFEAISYPEGMAYEKTPGQVAVDPKDQPNGRGARACGARANAFAFESGLGRVPDAEQAAERACFLRSSRVGSRSRSAPGCPRWCRGARPRTASSPTT